MCVGGGCSKAQSLRNALGSYVEVLQCFKRGLSVLRKFELAISIFMNSPQKDHLVSIGGAYSRAVLISILEHVRAALSQGHYLFEGGA